MLGFCFILIFGCNREVPIVSLSGSAWGTTYSIKIVSDQHITFEASEITSGIDSIVLDIDDNYIPKIGDFGLAKDSNTIKKDFNIQTCWYRCPEVVLNNQYSYEADLWSIGLIILELIIDKPIFKVKCDSELYFMMDLIVGQKPNYMFNKNPNFSITNLGISLDKRRRLEQYIITIEESMKLYIEDDLKPLIFGILKWDPSFRISLESCKVIIDNYLCNKK